jgi:hypothetical protein
MRVDVDPVVQTVQILISGKEGEIEQWRSLPTSKRLYYLILKVAKKENAALHQ